jgi:hypothetical protein
MYQKPSKRQQEARSRKLEAMRRGRAAARLARPASGRPPELPGLRRVVVVTDYDTGAPITHSLRLYRTRRVDTYRIEADGKPWRNGGWSVAMEGLRKAYPRVLSPRSSGWFGIQANDLGGNQPA